MAKRLKELREGSDLSLEGLSKELFERYGVKISSDSLMNYEVTDPYHTKARKNQGMRIEYPSILSAYYGVSSDYLMGRSDAKSVDPSMSAVMSYTGLSEKSVNMLHAVAKETHYEPPFDPLHILNFFISNSGFTVSLLCQISEYLIKCRDHFKASNDFDRKCNLLYNQDLLTLEAFDEQIKKELDVLFKYEDARDLALFRATRNFNSLLDDLVDEFCGKNTEIPDDFK